MFSLTLFFPPLSAVFNGFLQKSFKQKFVWLSPSSAQIYFPLYFCAEINTVLFLAFLICTLTIGCVLLRIVSVAPILVEILKPFPFSLPGRAVPISQGFSWAPCDFHPAQTPRVVCGKITPSPRRCSGMGGCAVRGAALPVFVADQSTELSSQFLNSGALIQHTLQKVPPGQLFPKVLPFLGVIAVLLAFGFAGSKWDDTKAPKLTLLDGHLPRVAEEGDISHSFPWNKSWQPWFEARCWIRQSRGWFDHSCPVTLTPGCLKMIFLWILGILSALESLSPQASLRGKAVTYSQVTSHGGSCRGFLESVGLIEARGASL